MRKIFLMMLLSVFAVMLVGEDLNDLEEFEIVLNKLARNYYNKNNKKKKDYWNVNEWSSAYRQEYEKNISKMVNLARAVQTEVVKANIKDVNLPKYAIEIRDAYNRRKQKRKNDILGNKSMWFPIHKLREELVTVKKAGLYKRTPRKKSKSGEPEEVEKINPENYTAKGLNELIQKYRDSLLEHNKNIEGIDEDTIKKFVNTLNDNQKKVYKKLIKKYKSQGYADKKQADASAVLELYTRWRDANTGNRKEMIEILTKMGMIEKPKKEKKEKK
jgi:hypothetical protein